MKKYFVTGLIILLPLTVTLVVVAFIFNILTEPFLGITKAIFEYYNVHAPEQLETIISQILILLFLIAFTIFLGFIARWFFFHYILRFWEALIHRIPFVNTIYKTCKDVIKTVFTTKTSAFKQVVMVQFPNPDTRTLGLVTREGLPGADTSLGEDLLVVFVPTTPNPTSGFLTIVRKQDVIPLDLSVEEAFKYVVSCGVIMSPFRRLKNNDTEETL